MGKECWIRTAQPIEPVPRALGPMDHPFVFAASPSNDIGIDPFQGWTQLRRIEVAVVVDPAPDARVAHRGQIAEGLVAAVMKRAQFRISRLMRVNAFGLTAGRKLCAKMRLSGLTHIVFRARNC